MCDQAFGFNTKFDDEVCGRQMTDCRRNEEYKFDVIIRISIEREGRQGTLKRARTE